VNRAGLEVDDRFRPLDKDGSPVPGVFAAGSVLAHQDWMREKCGSGLALATAYRCAQEAAQEA
jgi:glycerol-3-phosphate dehydrogenase subunit B